MFILYWLVKISLLVPNDECRFLRVIFIILCLIPWLITDSSTCLLNLNFYVHWFIAVLCHRFSRRVREWGEEATATVLLPQEVTEEEGAALALEDAMEGVEEIFLLVFWSETFATIVGKLFWLPLSAGFLLFSDVFCRIRCICVVNYRSQIGVSACEWLHFNRDEANDVDIRGLPLKLSTWLESFSLNMFISYYLVVDCEFFCRRSFLHVSFYILYNINI